MRLTTLGICGEAGCTTEAVAYIDQWSRMGRVSIVTGPAALVLAFSDPLPVYCITHIEALVDESLQRALTPV